MDEENAARAEEAEEAEEAARTATVCEDQGPSPKRARTFGNVPLAQQACAASSSGTGEDESEALTQERELAQEQQRAFDLAMGGSNLFITGGPGTGKSFTTQQVISALEERNGSGSVLVWAPTGIAAILVGGQTMQSKPGPGVPTSSADFEKVWGSKKYWRAVRTLVLDEPSAICGSRATHG